MTTELWVVGFFDVLAFAGILIAGRSTAMPADWQRRPGGRTEDHEFGLGFGCALAVLGIVGMLTLGVLWLVWHLRFIP